MNLTQNPYLEPLGKTLLHFLWQGTLLAAMLAFGLYTLRSRTAQVRYGLACLTLCLMALCPLLTFYALQQRKPVSLLSSAQPVLAQPHANSLLPLLVTIWFIGVIGFTLRLFWAWVGVYRLGHSKIHPLPQELEERGQKIAQQLGIRRTVHLFTSGIAQVPVAFGFVKQVVLLPAGALIGLTPQALEALLAHELAHIRRHDYLINLMQTVLETVLFYHPAIWWVSAQIRQERENSCDDMAIQIMGDRVAYARALASLEVWRAVPAQPALAANGSDLLNRIRRIAGAKTAQILPSKSSVTGMSVVLLGTLLVLLCLAAPKAKTAPKPAVKLASVDLSQSPTTSNLPEIGTTRAYRIEQKPKLPKRTPAPKAVIATKPAPKPAKQAKSAPSPTEPLDNMEAMAENIAQQTELAEDPENAWLQPIVKEASKQALKSLSTEKLNKAILQNKEAQHSLKEALKKVILHQNREVQHSLKEAEKEIFKAEKELKSAKEKHGADFGLEVGLSAIQATREALKQLGQ
jgi:beta-lactamase regulating signal transducer with metallopeptidase domain/ribosomal protein S20